MATVPGKGLIAIIGLLGALFGGGITASFSYLFESMSRDATELDSRRTDAYLNFITTRAKQADAYLRIKIAVEQAAKPNETKASMVSNIIDVCRRLIEHEKAFPNWSTDVKLQIRIVCEEEGVLRNKLYAIRDTVAIYGTNQVIEHLAKHERARHRDPNSKNARDSYAKLILKMRQDSTDRNNSSVNLNDLLAVICGSASPCLGYKDTSYLDDNQ
jgi:hypothetical protein